MKKLTVFLSYSSDDERLAGKYKEHLEKYYGFQVYVAHNDNLPSCDWGPEIKDQISNRDIFVVLISYAAKHSEFVNQEIGIAMASKIRIFPIKIEDINPFGFIYQIHGFPYIRDRDIGVLINGSKLFSILTSLRREFLSFGNLAIVSAIEALAESRCFKDSNIIIKTLMETEKARKFTPKQLKEIKRVCQSNFEVHGGAFEYSPLKNLLQTKYHIKELP